MLSFTVARLDLGIEGSLCLAFLDSPLELCRGRSDSKVRF